MPQMAKFTARIEFPNGRGYTPCTEEYARIKAQRDAIYTASEDGSSLQDLSADDYNLWNELDHELGRLQLDGHVGQSVRY